MDKHKPADQLIITADGSDVSCFQTKIRQNSQTTQNGGKGLVGGDH